ncbi:MAG: hypothetical protein GXO76_15315 [Calditrichaeota bacterium]|nr:hypothetical protein [Calditrichota bacterium]
MKYRNFLLIFLAIAVVFFGESCSKSIRKTTATANPSLSIEARVNMLLQQMTLEEKIRLLGGTGFTTQPIKRLGIPAMKMCDGPLGSRMKITKNGVEGGGVATNFSAPIAMAATWDDALIRQVGRAIGAETRAKGFDVILAPCINIARVPVGGRTFEAFGEDPFLVSRMTVAYVRGVQSQRVVATTKHYVANNQEKYRTLASSNVSERALREIYFPAFKAAVQEAGTRAIMASYNRINGDYACANHYLLTDVLKNEWGFTGLVMSDWGAVHSTIKTANAGLDLEMPRGRFFNQKLLEAVKTGQVKEGTIDEKVRRILRVEFEAGLFDHPPKTYPSSVDTASHDSLALKVAREAIVLLKNTGHILPLNRKSLHTLAVIGPNAGVAIISGGGSAYLESYKKVSPLEGIRKKVGNQIAVAYAPGARLKTGALPPIPSGDLRPPGSNQNIHGLLGQYFNNPNLEGRPALTRIDSTVYFNWHGRSPDPVIHPDNFSARWTGFYVPSASGTFQIGVSSDDGFRLFVNGKLFLEDWSDHGRELKAKPIRLEKGKAVALRLEYYERRGGASVQLGISMRTPEKDLREAVRLAKKSDAVILCVGLNRNLEGEGHDRTTLDLPADQERLIRAVSAVNPKTVVVLNNGTPVTMSHWLNRVPAVLEAWYTGQETGTALADIIFGDVTPSGKLPLTFPKSWADCPVAKTYPGTEKATDYSEGIYVGYRYYDSRHIEPLFPFGYGLSYTTFDYSNLEITPATLGTADTLHVHLTVTNSGPFAGDDIVQLYVHQNNPELDRPPKELKAFTRVHLDPGQSRIVSFQLQARRLGYFHPGKKAWVVEPGSYEIQIGKSSRDIQLTGELVVK